LRVVETGIQHGTLLVVIDGVHCEVTTFRQPADRDTHIDARDIATDLAGRDFTINAIAFCLRDRKLVDPFNGIGDLTAGIMRCVGDARARFSEDPLRMLRMVRFGSAQGRAVDSNTLEAATGLIAELQRVSVERIRHELEEILLSPYPAAALQSLLTLGALPWTIPELLPAVGFEQNRYHIHDVFDHTLAVVDRTPPDRILRWAAVFHDIGKPHTLSVDKEGERHFYSHEVVSNSLCQKRMEQLRFSHDDTKQICAVVRHHMRPLNCGPAGVRRLIRDLGDTLPLWRAFKDADTSPTISSDENVSTAQAFDSLLATERKRMEVPSYGRLAVNGEDLKSLGMKPGPAMGAILKQLEEAILEDPSKNDRAVLLELAQKLAGKKTGASGL
jgi:tRNA nucleotidyltransferase (CCA-adding enzyme)